MTATASIRTMNYWADFWCGVGFNVIPTNGKIPVVEGYKQFFDKAIPIELHNYWKKVGLFNNGIAIIDGKLWNHERRKHLFGHTIDCDNEAGVKLMTNINGVQYTSEDITKTGVAAEYHKGTPSRYHFIVFSEQEFPNLAPITGKDDSFPKLEVKGSGKLTTVTATMHEDGTCRELVGDSMKALENCVIHTEIMYHVNDKLKPYGVNYLNGKANGYGKSNNTARTLIDTDEKVYKGARNPNLYEYACSRLMKYWNKKPPSEIKKDVVDTNQIRCVPPLHSPEFEQIWNSAFKSVNEEMVKEASSNNNNNINNNSSGQQQQGQQQQSNTKTKKEKEEQEKPVSVLKAKRFHDGLVTVLGTIVSVSEMYVLEVVNAGKAVFKHAKSIQLEDTETLDENERLDVILYDDMVNKVIAGETVYVTGNMRVEDKKGGGNSKSKKKITVLHATSIKYLHRKEVLVTERDIETFHKFISYPKPIERLTAMFAPNIIGHDEVKRGLLRSIVGGVERGKKGGGRVDTLMVGDPGTAKSKLGTEASEIKPNSRHVDAPHATTKTITAIAEKINDSLTLVLGAIPLSKGAICAIDEITSFPVEDQSRLLAVLEEGKIYFDKLGMRVVIPSPTTIIATANPIQIRWRNSQVISMEEVDLKRNLIDRFTQIYGFRDGMEKEEAQKFVLEMDKINQRPPHNYNFLRKYLIHASEIKDVQFTKGARYTLNQFWVQGKVKESNPLTTRMYNGLYKMAEAQARLQLRHVLDEETAEQVLEDVRLIMVQYGETVAKIMGPREVAIKTCQDVLRRNE
jgi:MCM P-loop domain/MCM AAA-lid domain